MQMKASKKRILLCLLICCLFLASTVNIFGTSNSAVSDLYADNASSSSLGAEQSSMNSGNGLWHFNCHAITNLSSELFVSSTKPSQWLLAKTFFGLLTALIAGLITCLIFSSRLAGSLCSQFSPIGIIVFLHKKDGMK
ncbi:MAG: hypothetical protein ABRQ26_10435 [Syntrophomonadaceae bacterium]